MVILHNFYFMFFNELLIKENLIIEYLFNFRMIILKHMQNLKHLLLNDFSLNKKVLSISIIEGIIKIIQNRIINLNN